VLPEGQAQTVDVTVSAGPDESVTFSISVDSRAAAPTGLSVISGNGQLVSQGSNFEFRVASQRDGAPRSNVILNVIPNIEGRQEPLSICPTNAMTNEEGVATIKCRVGVIFVDRDKTLVQVADFGVRLPEPVEVFVTRTAPQGAGTLRIDSEEDFTVIANEPLADAIQVTALTGANGTPVANAEVFFTSTDDVIFDPPVAFTNLEGQASTTVTVGCITTPSVDIDIGFAPGEEIVDVSAEVDAGRFSEIVKIGGDNQSGFPGQRLSAAALVARTQDACGNDSERIPVEWSVRPAFAATLGNVVSVSDGSGRVSALVTLGSYGGPFQVEVGNDQDRVVFDVAVNLPAEELRLRSGDSQVAGNGQTLSQPLVVEALGVTGFGVAGVPVQWRVVEGPGVLLSRSDVTDNAGIAFANVRVGVAAVPQQQGAGPRVRVEATALGETVRFSVNGEAKPIAPVEAFVNGASFQSGWVPGGLGTIFGQFLSNVDGIAAADQVPFPTNFEGVTVQVAGLPAPLISIVGIDGSEQINLQVPFETPVGDADVTINNNGVEVVVNDVPINRVQPGVFEINIEGVRIAAALHQDFTLITPSDPARPGEVVQLFFTGAGPLSPAVGTNQPGPVPPAFTAVDVVVGIEGEGQESFGAFYAPQLVTANQVNFRLGADLSTGLRALTLVMDGVASQEVRLPVQ